jgi:Membrane-bound metallopeptidase
MNYSLHRKFALFVCYTIFFIITFCLSSVVYAQSKSEKEKLQQKKSKIEKEIKYTNKLLEETKKNKKLSLNRLVILNNKINKRQELISTIGTELQGIDSQIEINSLSIQRSSQELKDLKDEYAKMIYYAYKNRNYYNRIIFVFASKSFNQAFQRIKYFQQYSSYRKTQVKLIQNTQQQLNSKISILNDQKNQKLSLLQTHEREKIQLSTEKEEQNQSIKQLSQKERKLLATLRENEKAARQLQAAIQNLIAEEIRKSNVKAKKTGKKTPSTTLTYTHAEIALSNTFSANKGRLPWPSEKGIISSSYGEHNHPVLKGIKVKNNGINIATSAGSHARAIFEGIVTSILSIPNFNHVVILKHGEFLTVYSNLSEVYVKKGEKVSTKQALGVVSTDNETSKTELHFEIWKGKTTQDPAQWISR